MRFVAVHICWDNAWHPLVSRALATTRKNRQRQILATPIELSNLKINGKCVQDGWQWSNGRRESSPVKQSSSNPASTRALQMVKSGSYAYELSRRSRTRTRQLHIFVHEKENDVSTIEPAGNFTYFLVQVGLTQLEDSVWQRYRPLSSLELGCCQRLWPPPARRIFQQYVCTSPQPLAELRPNRFRH
jgi:hypothetical protein